MTLADPRGGGRLGRPERDHPLGGNVVPRRRRPGRRPTSSPPLRLSADMRHCLEIRPASLGRVGERQTQVAGHVFGQQRAIVGRKTFRQSGIRPACRSPAVIGQLEHVRHRRVGQREGRGLRVPRWACWPRSRTACRARRTSAHRGWSAASLRSSHPGRWRCPPSTAPGFILRDKRIRDQRRAPWRPAPARPRSPGRHV